MQIPYTQIVTRFLVGVNQNLPIIIAILNPSKGELLGFLGGLHWLGINIAMLLTVVVAIVIFFTCGKNRHCHGAA